MSQITLVSFGKNQKCTPSFLRPRWRMRILLCRRKMPQFPLTDKVYFGDEPQVVHFYENNPQTTGFIFDTFSALLSWIGKHKKGTLTIYVRSTNGLIRSVYAVNKLAELLQSQGHTTEAVHLELSRTKK